VYPTSSHVNPSTLTNWQLFRTKVKVTITINRQSVSAHYHEFPGVNLPQTSYHTSLPKLLAWDCFSGQKIKFTVTINRKSVSTFTVSNFEPCNPSILHLTRGLVLLSDILFSNVYHLIPGIFCSRLKKLLKKFPHKDKVVFNIIFISL